jgi:hypothetical protein
MRTGRLTGCMIALLVVVVAVAVGCGGGENGAPPSPTPPAPAATAAAAATPTGAPAATGAPAVPIALEWSRLVGQEAVFGGDGAQRLWSVVAGGPGLVAVGEDGPVGDADAAVWTSVDGSTWSRVAHDEAVFGGDGSQVMRSVVVGGPGLVAVGYGQSGDDFDAAVWTSADSATWSRVPHDEDIFGGNGNQFMFDVVAGGPGFVAVGADVSGGDADTAIWTSADGLTWSRVPHDEEVFGGEDVQRVWSVTVGGPGLVAVGVAGPSPDVDGAVWTSVDGETWTRVPHDEAVFGGDGVQWMWSVVEGGPGLVAVGYDESGADGDKEAAVWTSTDGEAWTRVPQDAAVFGGAGEQRMWGVAATDAGLVAVGADGSGGDFDGAVWTSVDGISWARLPDAEASLGGPGDQTMTYVAVVGPDLVAVGYEGPSDEADGAVWTAPAP